MLRYNPSSCRKISIWVHPNARVNQPLHPIDTGSDFDREIKFITCLKITLKELLPSLSIGPGRTFFKILFHLEELKKQMMKEEQ